MVSKISRFHWDLRISMGFQDFMRSQYLSKSHKDSNSDSNRILLRFLREFHSDFNTLHLLNSRLGCYKLAATSFLLPLSSPPRLLEACPCYMFRQFIHYFAS